MHCGHEVDTKMSLNRFVRLFLTHCSILIVVGNRYMFDARVVTYECLILNSLRYALSCAMIHAEIHMASYSPVHTSNIVECYNVECCFDIVAVFDNIVEATGNFVACCFDNVASTLLLVWTGLK